MKPIESNFKDLLKLNKSHIVPAAEVLSRAFLNYPLFLHFFPDISERKTITTYLFRYSLSYTMQYGDIFTTSPNLEGVALWLHSNYYPMTFWRVLRSVPISTILNIGMKQGSRMKYAGEYIDMVHQHLVPSPHWFLQVIGIDPEFQGNGYAGKLLRPMFNRMDIKEFSCYLETQDEANVPIYEHYGFKVVEKSTIPRTTLTNWAMLRGKP